MKKIIFVFIFILTSFVRSQSVWQSVYYDYGVFLNKIYFINPNTGFVVGSTNSTNNWLILKTNNGGLNWVSNVGAWLTNQLTSITFTDYNTGYITGGYFGSQNYILKTTDQGNNWSKININLYNYLWDISFLNSNTGLICSEGTILRTENAGYDWTPITNIPYVTYYSVKFSKSGSGVCYAVGNRSCIIKSTNAGLNWTTLTYNINSNDTLYHSIDILNDMLCYVGGARVNSPSNGVLIKTSDGGNTWQHIGLNTSYFNNYQCNPVFFSESTGIISTVGVFRTTNGGLNWNIAEAPYHYNYHDIFFTDSLNGYAIMGWDGIIKTTTGGYGPPNAPTLGCTRKYGVNRLTWSNNSISELGFRIQRCNLSDTSWNIIASVSENTVTYNDSNSTEYVKYRVYAYNNYGNSAYSNEVIPTVLFNHENTTQLDNPHISNHPNPFNSRTTIRYSLTKSGNVRIVLTDIRGKEISVLVTGKKDAGKYEIIWDAFNFSSGIYFCKIITNDFMKVQKLILLK